jgi:hypothetical protein
VEHGTGSSYSDVITPAGLDAAQITSVELRCASSGLRECVDLRIESPSLATGVINAVDIPIDIANRLLKWMQENA